ncbi:hypothetical protein BB8028_0008g00590 [Beauveria bassiana]|uniref:Oxidase ustYa n=1 Tax=Beauveria bassiana TaxID=176275 RepID=A0A2S7YNK9_BEABA|nr:hypothetical protein BB8028_0008g00590 [Beauveria bassiana]
MERSFKDEDSARASSEFLIEHQSRTRSPSQKPWSKLKAATVIVLFLVGSLELIVLETILVRMSEKNSCPPTLLGELNSLVPNFPIKPMLFRKDPSATVDHDSEQSRNKTRDDWLSYMPRGNGFIAVNDSAQYKLPDPILFQGRDTYSIAVFHQMHCLYAIMDRYNDLTSGSAEGQQGHAQHGDHDRRGSESHRHVDHCFRYLRQSLLCCGDTALEGQDPNTDKAATNGVGAVHMCKDFEAIRSWAEDNRLVDHKGE